MVDREKIPSGFAKGSTLTVLPNNEDSEMGRSSLQTKEVAAKLSLGLAQRGYSIKKLSDPDRNNLDYVVMFNYGITSETRNEVKSFYIPGQTVTVQGNASTFGHVNGSYSHANYNEFTNASTVATSSGTYTYIPVTVTYHTKFLLCSVYDAKECQKYVDSKDKNKKMPQELWQGTACNVNTDAELKCYLDYLIIQLCRLFGTATSSDISTTIVESDEDFELMRKAYECPNLENV